MNTTLEFDASFFNEETKNEYVISNKQKKIWACELDLANKLLEVCCKYEIKIMSFAGTLLGAVRHNGFIPWDDDMDFCLLRKDYERLCSIAEKEFLYPYFFQTALTDKNYLIGYARLRNSTTTGIITNQDIDYNCGIYIDIFVLDGYIEDSKLLKRQIRKRNFLYIVGGVYSPSRRRSPLFYKIIKDFIRFGFSKIRTYENTYESLKDTLTKYNDCTEKVTFLTHPYSQLIKYWIYKSDFDNIVFVDFENIRIPISVEYDRILRNTYGDYMSLPSLEDRGKWHSGLIEFDPDISYEEYFKKTEKKR